MELSVLGPLEASGTGGRIPLRRLERRLVAALVVRRGGGVGVDELVEALWPEGPPPSAVHTLRTHVTRIRHVLGADAIATVGGAYRLDPGIALDVDAFERAVREAESSDGLEPWTTAVSLWRGEPLVEIADWLPAAAERARLLELGHRAREGWCAALIRSRTTDAVAEAERLVQAEPLREHRWALLMQALATAGRRPEALRAFDRARHTLATELGVSPGHELSQLHGSLVAEDVAPRSLQPAGRLPTPLSTFVGRPDEIDRVGGALRDHRLVTLTGVGGVGKTRLAVVVADRAAAEYSGGVWLVSLVGAAESADVDTAVASSLGVLVTGERPVRDLVADAIGGRRLLILLDNCEHVLDAAADLVSDLLGRCPQLAVLATSRGPLAIAGERRINVAPLAIDGAARELLLTRATESGATIPATAGPVLDALGRRLAGIPLVIELAAAHIGTLGLPALLDRLSRQLDVVAAGRRDALGHHRTVRGTLDWSWDLLDDASRRVFARLGMFAGPFDLMAAGKVAGGPPGADVTEPLATLIDASMVVAEHAGPTPYRLLEPLRHYALERLAAAGETDEVSARHASSMASLAESLGLRLRGPEEIGAAAGIAAVRDDLRAALRSAVGRGDADVALRLVVALADYAEGHVWIEPWSWSQLALDLPRARHHPRRAAALVVAAVGAWQLGRPQRCVELVDEALACSVEGEDAWAEAQRLRGNGLLWLGRLDESVACLQHAVAMDPDPGSSQGLRRRATLALILNHSGRPDRLAADALLDDAVVLQHPTSLALAHHVRGVVLALTEPAIALQHQVRAAETAARSGAVLLQGFAMAALAESGQSDPKARARAITDVMDHYLRLGNRAHLRGFGRSIIVPLAQCNDWEAVALVDAATRAEPSFARSADLIGDAVQRANQFLPDAADVSRRGSAMSDAELVIWLRARVG